MGRLEQVEEPMADPVSESSLYVVFTAGGQRYAVRHEAVVEMVQPPSVVPLPGAGRGVLGLINLRGKVLGLVDFRLALGQRSSQEEMQALIQDLHTFEKHHLDWVDELEASVRDQRPFRLTTDPHACAFGRWFDAFRSDNVVLHQHLQAFSEPHQAVHAVAKKVVAHVEAGEADKAIEVIGKARTTVLATMLTLFRQTRAAIAETRREIAIVMPGGGSMVAVLVDSVEAIGGLTMQDDSELGEAAHHPLLCGVATDANDDLVLLVDADAVFGVFGKVAA
ncbi:MAG: chemotaxis protein CheW [Alphaproteobacteria bacterium]|nr:chemotaxis protein CheW [Alphaproteobacteria bacterium]